MGERSWSGAVRHRWPGADRSDQNPDRWRRAVADQGGRAARPAASPTSCRWRRAFRASTRPEPIKRFVARAHGRGRLRPLLGDARACRSCARRSPRRCCARAWRYDPDGEIIVTAGSIEAIAATLLALVRAAGDEVLVVSPTYASYIPAIRLAGGVPRFVPLDEDANFDLDPDAIAAAVGRRTRALILCNPNNPTGTVFSARADRGACWRSPSGTTSWSSPTRSTRTSSTARHASTARRREPHGAPPRRARLLVLEGLRHDRLARRLPARTRASASPTSSRCTTRWSPARRWSRSTPRWPRSSSATRSSPTFAPSSAAAATTSSSGSTRCRTSSTTRSRTRRTSCSRG